MRAAIFNPYLDTLGGGERYSMAMARVLTDAGYSVDVEWKTKGIKEKIEERFGLDLTGIDFVKDIKRGDGYDVCFWVSDGSIPTLGARKNFLHFQVPFRGVSGRTLLNKMKLFRINKIICNSYFTKSYIDKEYGVNSIVIYPPVSAEKIRPKRKTNIILFVGRFSQLVQAKNQHVLVRNFKKFIKVHFDWKLILAGGAEVGAKKYLAKLEKDIQGYPIKIIKSPTLKELRNLYGEAKFFWSAVGFGAKEEKEPQRMEHFGITVVEAMAGGAVPVVFSGGGHKEIIKEGITGFLWETGKQLINRTSKLIEDKKLYNTIARNTLEESRKFSYERFVADVKKIL